MDTGYDRLLALPAGGIKEPDRLALAQAHELRRFEIQNYWSRATYIWGFQLAAFGAVALSAKEGMVQPRLALPIAAFGALTALAGLLISKGSKFWQENWERHVDQLEDKVTGRLMKTVLIQKSQVSFSVSRVNEALLECLTAGWLLAFCTSAVVLPWPGLLSLSARSADMIDIGIVGACLIGGMARLTIGKRSRLAGRLYDHESFEPVSRPTGHIC